MTLTKTAARLVALVALVVGLLAAETGTTAGASTTARAAAAAPTGTVSVTIRTPAGVPGVVVLKSGGRKRTVTKRPAGTRTTVRVRLPIGRWSVVPQRVVARRTIFAGTANRTTLVVRRNGASGVTVTYRAAPAVRSLRVSDLQPRQVSLAWGAPERGATYLVRRAEGVEPPSSPGTGVNVRVVGTTATATGLKPATDYAFAVFARRKGTTVWGKPVTTRTTTPSPAGPGVVVDPATVLVEEDAPVEVEVTPEGVVARVPAGVVPTPGQPWVLPRSAALPGGFVGTVVAVSPDGSSVTLAPGGLADAFDYLEIRAPDLSAIPLETAGAARLAGVGFDCSGEGPTPDLDPSVSVDPFGHFSATLKKKEVAWAPDIPLGMTFDARFGVDVEASFSASVSASVSCEVTLPAITLTLPAGPVPILIVIEPRGTLSIGGEISVGNIGFTARLGATAKGHLGAGGDDSFDGDLLASIEPLTPTVETSGSATLQVGAGVSVGPGLGLTGVAGATVGVSADLNAVDAAVTPGFGEGCVEVRAGRSASVAITARAWLGSWDEERSIDVPGLGGYDDWAGSPWYFPSGCGGPGEYRIESGTLAVAHSVTAGCANDRGWCDDGPDSTSSRSWQETSDARLVVAEPGDWTAHHPGSPAYLTAPMRFLGWDYDAASVDTGSSDGCTYHHRDETVGDVEFGSAYWETATSVAPAPGPALEVELDQYYWTDWPEDGAWTDFWTGWFGAWDTDLSNEFPRIGTRSTTAWGGTCEGSSVYESQWTLQGLGPGAWYAHMEEGREVSVDVTVTPLEGCEPQLCRFRVDGVQRYEFRSRISEDYGLEGDGTLTMTWSYVIERRPQTG